jgi:hypothetical protein
MKTAERITGRTFCTALAIVVTCVVAFWVQYPPRYLTNDDVAIRLGIEGHAIPGEGATGFVLMTHAALGWALVWLHRMLPGAPLWDIAVVGTLLCSTALLFALTWTALGAGWLARGTAAGVLAVTVLPLLLDVQFTIAATLAGAAAILLATTELASGAPRRSILGMATALLLAGLLVRPMGASAGAAIVGLSLMPGAICQARPRGTALARAAGALGAAVALSAGLLYADGLLYRIDRAWDEYYRYNWMAAQLAEWGGELPPADVQTIRAAAGWSSNDWAMMQRWLAADPGLHGLTQVSRAYQARSTTLEWTRWFAWLADRTASVGGDAARHVTIDSAALLVAIATVAVIYMGWQSRAALTLGMLVFVGLCVALEVRFKDLPFRLLGPLQAGVAATALLIAARQRRAPGPAAAIVGLAIVLTLVTYHVRSALPAAARDRLHTAQVEREVLQLRKLSPSLIVIQADAFPSEHWWRPFVQPVQELDVVRVSAGDPLLQHFLTRTGRQPLFRAVCDDPSILVISEQDRLELVTTYLREHFGDRIRWTPVYAGSFRAWRCGR